MVKIAGPVSPLDQMRQSVEKAMADVLEIAMDAGLWEDLIEQHPDAATELEVAASAAHDALEGWLTKHPAGPGPEDAT